jgi:hypothetical protein
VTGGGVTGGGLTGSAMNTMRGDRLYLGWQYAVIHPDPGPPPRRPTPPEREQVNPGWLQAQRREENLLNRPLKVTFGAAVAVAGLLAVMWVLGWLNAALAVLGIIVCLFGAALTGYALWQGKQALRSRVADEHRRVGKLRVEQENQLFAWQAEHARRAREWQALRAAYEQQKHWYAICLPADIDRVDVAGGTLSGWSAMLTMIGATRLAAGGEVTVLDLSEGAVARDLVGFARASGITPLVWVLPEDLPRLDLGTGLHGEALADVLSLAVSACDEQGSARDLAYDNAILERVIEVLGGGAPGGGAGSGVTAGGVLGGGVPGGGLTVAQVTVAQVTAALRALAQVGDPRLDAASGLITMEQIDRLTTMFGRGAADRVVVERAWALESQLRRLESIGSDLVPLPPSTLRVISVDRRAGAAGNKVLGTYAVTALTHMLRQAPTRQPWQHTLFVPGAERLRADVLDRLADACEAAKTGLILAHRSLPPHVRERLGRGNAAVAFMRLGNAEDAKAASEQIGTEHRFLLSQLTETVGTSVTDTTGDSYTSSVGTADSATTSTSASEAYGRSSGQGRSEDGSPLPFGSATWSRSRDTSHSLVTGESESVTEGINSSSAWAVSTAKATGGSESAARTAQRSREFLVEQHELQQLPASALILTYASAAGRRVVMTDVNPAILGLPAATLLTLDEARQVPLTIPPEGSAAAPDPAAQPPPNLGPPPRRLDWRRHRHR